VQEWDLARGFQVIPNFAEFLKEFISCLYLSVSQMAAGTRQALKELHEEQAGWGFSFG
jgi:hypothetical protein